jgi:spermidine/putrescine transport system permease protein
MGKLLDALTNTSAQFFRSFLFATMATIIALAIAYPLAYGIAFKSENTKTYF